MSLPKANATSIQTLGHGQGCGYGRGRGRGCGHDRGRGKPNSSHRSSSQSKKNNSNHQKWNNSKVKHEKGIEPQSKHACENKYHRCGMKGHWSRTYCTSKHLVNLYQALIKGKGKKVEMNFIDSDDPVDLTHLEVSDFFENPNGKIDHLIGDGNVCYD